MAYTGLPHELSSDSIRLVLVDDENWTTDKTPNSAKDKGLKGITVELDRLQMSSEKLRAPISHHTSKFRDKTPKPRPNNKYCTISPEMTGSPKKHHLIHHHPQGQRIAAIKSQSLPRNSSLTSVNSAESGITAVAEVDTTVGNVLCLAVDDLASQMTLLDKQVFAAIQISEFQSCCWTKKEKCITSPNIVAMTRRFNNVSFWVVQEILNGVTAKERADIISHCIKIAKRLYELNNLHSLFAIVSALRSASIYRMNNTWNALSKKDKQTLDKLAQLFSEDNNWETLRQYLETLKLPCIPYLGLYLTDLVYIDLAFPNRTKGLDIESTRESKMNNILRIISEFQSSDYSFIEAKPEIQKYLQSMRYIEELQNIFEEEQYKKSLLLEPKMQTSTPSTSKESVVSNLNLSPAKSSSMRATSSAVGPNGMLLSQKFKPGHRKCQSLGTNIFHRFQNQTQLRPCSSSANKSGIVNGGADVVNRHLLDDSELNETPKDIPESPQELHDISLKSPLSDSLDFQGYVRRKTILKEGKKPTVSSWQRFWIQIWANSLIYFPPKSLKGCERSDFKREPSKIRSLEGWRATSVENTQQGNTFQLINQDLGHIYKFRTSSSEMTSLWLKALQGNNNDQEKQTAGNGTRQVNSKYGSANLMTFE
ncbi:ras-specific guanine nucleotide-releasing factor RalGPS2-like [Culicoides brevitarsis]|uniref:ras-specific guanine nucleotide-releasing factor RalGPS2-like n=1 Tax=Culicoides brevitarsis TaxID=469753 RepID=UPI00307BD9D2